METLEPIARAMTTVVKRREETAFNRQKKREKMWRDLNMVGKNGFISKTHRPERQRNVERNRNRVSCCFAHMLAIRVLVLVFVWHFLSLSLLRSCIFSYLSLKRGSHSALCVRVCTFSAISGEHELLMSTVNVWCSFFFTWAVSQPECDRRDSLRMLRPHQFRQVAAHGRGTAPPRSRSQTPTCLPAPCG